MWILAAGQLHWTVRAGDPPKAIAPSITDATRIFAAHDSAGVVVANAKGLVWHVSPTSARVLVGDPAVNLDISKVTSVGALPGKLVVGGARPHLYRGLTRSWQALDVGEVVEIVSAADALWLRTAQLGIHCVRANEDAVVNVSPPKPVVKLAGQRGRLLALANDSSVWLRTANNWVALSDPTGGPRAEMVEHLAMRPRSVTIFILPAAIKENFGTSRGRDNNGIKLSKTAKC